MLLGRRLGVGAGWGVRSLFRRGGGRGVDERAFDGIEGHD